MTKRTQGDVKFFLTEDGMTIDVRGGQPLMGSGLGTAIIISLFSTEGWVGDHFSGSLEKLGGEFEKAANGPITVSTLVKARDAAKRDLAWLVTSGAAEAVDVNVKAPAHDRLELTVYVTPPGGNVEKFQLNKFGESWVSQSEDGEGQDGL